MYAALWNDIYVVLCPINYTAVAVMDEWEGVYPKLKTVSEQCSFIFIFYISLAHDT